MLLMVGGQAMGLHNDGRTTVFPGVKHANNRQLSNFYNTLGYAAGMQLDCSRAGWLMGRRAA